MKKGWLLIRLFACAMFFHQNVSAQKDSGRLISLSLDSAHIAQIVDELEKQTSLHFYYDQAQFDSFAISIHVQNLPVNKVLEQVFTQTDFQFAFVAPNYAFITKGKTIATTLPAELSPGNVAAAGDSSLKKSANRETGSEKNAVRTTLENKVYDIGDKSASTPQKNVIVAGNATDAKTGEPIPGAYLYVDNTNISAITDQYGYFSLSMPPGRHTINIQSLGMKDTRRLVHVYGDGKLNIDLQSQVLTIRNVTISSQKISNVKGTQMGLQKIDIKTIKQVPVVFGEVDILRVVTTLPGVKTVGEASTGLNVRGGSADQNLILFNEATIYNPSHFFGMFSAFNPEIVRDVELYKSSVPARYGGRLSSVLNINAREGNKKKLTGTAGVGLLTGRFNLEGPLIKDKTSFIIGARTT